MGDFMNWDIFFTFIIGGVFGGVLAIILFIILVIHSISKGG